MDQGTKEWHLLRKNKIGASDAPVIMGTSPWKTIPQLWEEKVGLAEDKKPTYYQQRGLFLEDQARFHFYLIHGIEVFPEVRVHPVHDWMMASCDGLSKDGKVLLEIKHLNPKDHELAINGKIPEKYYAQLQHLLEVYQLDEGFYLSSDGEYSKFENDSIKIITFYRDQNYIDNMIVREKEFYQSMINFIPPASFSNIEDPKWDNTVAQIRAVQTKIKELESQQNNLKSELIQIANGRDIESNGVKLTKFIRKGSIDYQKILDELNIQVDLDKYRKEDSETWKLTING